MLAVNGASADATVAPPPCSSDAEDADGIFEFPTFEALDSDDRPPAPSQEDYPAGCEVELVDAHKAKIAQTEQFWEPHMDELFAARRKVRVVRHSGEYTFVERRVGAELTIGCTLYRACLKEPKVKFRRYNPYEPAAEAGGSVARSDLSSSAVAAVAADEAGGDGGDDEDSDELMRAIGPSNGASPSATLPPLAPPPAALTAAPGPTPTVSPSPPPPAPSATPSPPRGYFSHPVSASSQQARRLRDRGNRAFQEGRFEDAVAAYTAALELGYPDTLRIYSNRSAALLALRQTERALEDARACIRADPHRVTGYVREANVMRALKRFDVARKLYMRALAIEPQNADINFALMCNSAAEFFRVRTENLPVVVNLRQQTGMLEVVSRRKHECEETVFVEIPHVVVPVQAALVGDGHFCGECLRALIRREEVADHFSIRETRHLVNTLFPDVHHHVVACSERCGQRYCSEACRNRAWAAHHWLECPVRGKWGRSVAACRALVYGSPALSDPERARVMLAVRMLVTMCSTGRALGEAITTFTWLPTPRGAPAPGPAVDGVLRAVFGALQGNFGRDESALLDWALFSRTYTQAGAGIAVRCTPWTSFAGKVEAHLALLTQKNDTTGVADTLAVMLDSGRTIPHLSIDAVAVLSIFALCAQPPPPPTRSSSQAAASTASQSSASASSSSVAAAASTALPGAPNVALRADAESTHAIHVAACAPIRRGEVLRAAPSVFVAHSCCSSGGGGT